MGVVDVKGTVKELNKFFNWLVEKGYVEGTNSKEIVKEYLSENYIKIER